MSNETEITIESTEITSLNFDSYIDVINEMIFEIALETEAYIPDIIEDIAKFYNIPSYLLIRKLKGINSAYTANNNIVYYFNNSPVKRTAYSCAQRKVICKLGTTLKKAYTGIEDATVVFMKNIQIILNKQHITL